MAWMTKQQQERKAQGVCWECGGKIDRPGHYVRCAECRERFTEYMRLRRELKGALLEQTPNEIWAHKKAEQERQRALAEEKRRIRLGRCMECVWAHHEEGTLYCPFMEGVCMRGAGYE